jgi:ribonuclease Z
MFKVIVLGSSSALPTAKRFTTAQVLNVHERFFLIDCGEGTQIQLRRFSVNISRISHLFISHLHGDHVFGTFGLLSSYNLMGRKADFHIYAHPDFGSTLDHFLEHFGKDMSYKIVFHPFHASNEIIYSDKHITVTAFPLRHSIPVAGFLFREKGKLLNINKEILQKHNLSIKDIRNIKEGQDYITDKGEVIKNSLLTLPPYRPRSYAYCTDTLYFRKISDYVKDADILYCEATFSDKDRKIAKLTGHATAVQAAKLAIQADAGKLLIGHFSTRYKSTDGLLEEARSVFVNTFAVEDGDEFIIEQKRVADIKSGSRG